MAEFLFGSCTGLTWQGFGSWGCRGACVRRGQGLPLGWTEPDTACSKIGPSLAKAELISEAGDTSEIR